MDLAPSCPSPACQFKALRWERFIGTPVLKENSKQYLDLLETRIKAASKPSRAASHHLAERFGLVKAFERFFESLRGCPTQQLPWIRDCSAKSTPPLLGMYNGARILPQPYVAWWKVTIMSSTSAGWFWRI